MAEFIKKETLRKGYTSHLLEQFNDICPSHFRNMLKCRQKQISWEHYLSKRPLVSQSEGQSDPKKQRREEVSDKNSEIEKRKINFKRFVNLSVYGYNLKIKNKTKSNQFNMVFLLHLE